MKKVWGKMLLVDAYKCNPLLLDDIEVVYRFLEKALDILDVSKQAPPQIFHSPTEYMKNGIIIDCSDKAGISGWVPLIESSIVIHTLTETGFMTVDYYTCGNLNKKQQKDLVKLCMDTFEAEDSESQFVNRGNK